MTIDELRLKHPRLVYKTYAIDTGPTSVTFRFELVLEPDIVFRPEVTIPFSGHVDEQALAPFVFHIGLVEAISYWKAACPGELVVEAGGLSEDQLGFWYDLFLHGLGEFYYVNGIDFTRQDFLRIRAVSSTPLFPAPGSPIVPSGDLVLVGGGKDSAVTLGMMKKADRTIQTMVLNPTEAALNTIQASGYKNPIVITRRIDPKLLDLNRSGYLNGHTPFSAYLAFLGTACAVLMGYEHVIVSNERSADEGNVTYRGMEINHQYSKSFRFEQLFRAYAASYLPYPTPEDDRAIPYFSFLRPLNDLQIGKLFASYPQFFTTFRSCNVGSKTNTWCGTCAKCAFTYLTLAPYLSHEQLVISFGDDLFTHPEIITHIRALTGLMAVKPFECVGTRNEAKFAVALVVEKYLAEGREVPEGLLKVKIDLGMSDAEVAGLRKTVLEEWGDTYNLPEEYLTLLREAWEKAS